MLSNQPSTTVLRRPQLLKVGIKMPRGVVFWTTSIIKDEKSAAKFQYIKTVCGKVVVQEIRHYHTGRFQHTVEFLQQCIGLDKKNFGLHMWREMVCQETRLILPLAVQNFMIVPSAMIPG